MSPLTQKQLDALRFIHRYQSRYGIAPSLREINAAVLSHPGYYSHVKRLLALGYLGQAQLKRRGPVARSWYVTDTGLVACGLAPAKPEAPRRRRTSFPEPLGVGA